MLPPVDEWFPENHLARFVVRLSTGSIFRAMSGSYRGSGSASYHPRMLLGILVYGYATGVFSSRKLERATYDSVAFRFIAANDHPDHDTIATFRRRFLEEIEALFVQVLLLAREMGVLKMGTVALDGTKIHANASRHSALSHGTRRRSRRTESRGRRSDGQSRGGRRGGHSRRHVDSGRIRRGARSVWASWPRRGRRSRRGAGRTPCARTGGARGQAAAQAKAEASGKKPRGKPSKPPVEGLRPNDQINLTDEDRASCRYAGALTNVTTPKPPWRRKPAAVASAVSQAANDKQQTRTDAGQDRGSSSASQARKPAGGYGLF